MNDRKARALELLRLATALEVDAPRPGFEARLRARIRSAPSEPAPTWADGIGLVARPALGLATVALLICLAWTGWTYTQSPAGDDLVAAAGGDPLLDAVSADGLDAIAAEGAGSETP